MGRFDDIIERNTRRYSEDGEEETSPQGPPINLMELLEAEDSPFGSLLENVNPEMKSKILVPLMGLLDKYGLGDSLGKSQTATSAVGLMSVLGDIAPVVKGISEFVTGQRNSLADEDKQFLQDIMAADNSSEFSDLFTDIGESEASAPVNTASNTINHPLLGEIPQVNPHEGPVDWMSVLDPDGKFGSEDRQRKEQVDAYAELMPKAIFDDAPKILDQTKIRLKMRFLMYPRTSLILLLWNLLLIRNLWMRFSILVMMRLLSWKHKDILLMR
jgi:hypothetical protein